MSPARKFFADYYKKLLSPVKDPKDKTLDKALPETHPTISFGPDAQLSWPKPDDIDNNKLVTTDKDNNCLQTSSQLVKYAAQTLGLTGQAPVCDTWWGSAS